MEVRSTGPTPVDGEVFLQFVHARAAYRNGLKVLSPTITEQCVVGPTATEPSCAFFTGDCASCPPDPNYPGVLSCFCRKGDPAWSKSMPVTLVPAGATRQVGLGLVTDRFGSGFIDQRFYADPSLNPLGSDQLRTELVGFRQFLLQWEDLHLSGDGDFNDLEIMASVRDCASGPMPPDTTKPEGLIQWQCGDQPCEGGVDCDPPEFLDLDQLQFYAFVTVDENLGNEVDREWRGRILRLTLSTFGSGLAAGRRIAMCPAVVLDNPGPQTVDWHVNWYGYEAIDCAPEEQVDGEPSLCDTFVPTPYQYHFVNLARDQHEVLKSCDAPRVGPGDGFEVVAPEQLASGCMANMAHTESYEISLESLDKLLAGAGIPLVTNTMPAQDVLQVIRGVGIYAFIDLQAEPFFCPVGLNNSVGGVNQQLAKLQQILLIQGQSLGFEKRVRP